MCPDLPDAILANDLNGQQVMDGGVLLSLVIFLIIIYARDAETLSFWLYSTTQSAYLGISYEPPRSSTCRDTIPA